MTAVNPRVSVLMPVFNAADFVGQAVESILNQSYIDFELLIINDGSTDGTSEILKSYTDRRIRVIEHEKNRGIISSLNEGILICQGEYIIRMDADDISFPDRLRMQVDFMDIHPFISASGTSVSFLVNGVPKGSWIVSSERNIIQMQLMLAPCFAHPTVILRRQDLLKSKLRYDEDYIHAEDYALWIEMSRAGMLFGNLSEVLLHYRVHPSSISQQRSDIQRRNTVRIRNIQLEAFLGRLLTTFEKHIISCPDGVLDTWSEFWGCAFFLSRLSMLNRISNKFPKSEFHQMWSLFLLRKFRLGSFARSAMSGIFRFSFGIKLVHSISLLARP